MNDFAPLISPLEEFRAAHPGVDLAYGVIADGRLAHATAPDTVFRIASMTKSFVAATALLLRDRGVLDFDAPIEEHVPAAEALRLPDGVHPHLTLRQLLSMQGGLPTDDPWADRLEALPATEFDELLGSGIRFVAEPGTRFKYSNLGYAIVGRALELADGRPLPDLVAAELLDPLGLHSTGFSPAQVRSRRADAGLPEPEIAVGRRRRTDGSLEELSQSGPGAFSPIGGLYSTVGDLATWVEGLMSAGHGAGVLAVPESAEPPEDERLGPGPVGPEGTAHLHPLSRAQRQEMQAAHRLIEVRNRFDVAAGAAVAQVQAYGFGLRTVEDSRFGTLVWHAGGYPGFGSCMRWHAETGIGVIALAGLTYAPLDAALERGFIDLLSPGHRTPEREVTAARRWRPAVAQRAELWPELRGVPAAIEGLIEDFDDARADELFSPNMDADVPRPERKAVLARSREVVGPPLVSQTSEVTYLSPARVAWRRTGTSGWRRAMVSLDPLGRVQSLAVESYAAPRPDVGRALELIVAALDGFDFLWPAELDFAGADLVGLAAAARVARTLGSPERGRLIATGHDWATAEVRFGTSSWHLTLELVAERAYPGVRSCILVNISL